MTEQELEKIILTEFPDAQVKIEADGKHFEIYIISDVFQGKSLVKRQQKIYSLLSEHILSGKLHAVSIHAMTLGEAEKNNG